MWASCIRSGARGYDLAQAPLLFELELDAVLQRQVPEFKQVSKLQPVERDIAVIVAEGVTHAALMGAIHGAATQGLLKGATLFDVYRPQQASASMQLGEKKPGRALGAFQRHRYTDRRGN